MNLLKGGFYTLESIFMRTRMKSLLLRLLRLEKKKNSAFTDEVYEMLLCCEVIIVKMIVRRVHVNVLFCDKKKKQ